MANYCLFFFSLLSLSARGQSPRDIFLMDSLRNRMASLDERPFSIERDSEAAQVLNRISWLQNDCRQFDQGLFSARRAFDVAEKHHFYAQMAQAQLNMGYAIQKQERYFEAVIYFERAKKMAQHAHNDSLLANSYHLAGMCYSDQDLPRKSIENYRQELPIDRRLNLTHKLAPCYNSLGLDYLKTKQPDSALYFFRECLKAAKKIDDNLHTAAAYKNIGRVLIGNGQDSAGVAALQNSVNYFLICRDENQRDAVNYSYTILAEFYSKKKQYRRSTYYGKLTWDLVNRLGYTDQKAEIAQVLYRNYKAIGDKEQAIFYLEKYSETSLKINQDLINQQHIAAEARFNDEKQKNQIVVLNQEKAKKAVERNWLIGSLIAAVFLVSAIGLLYQTVRKQKKLIEAINLHLEEKVVERTAELRLALEEIKSAQLHGQKLERRRVAADLHDNLGGMISAIRLTIEAMDSSELSRKEQQVYQNVLSMTRLAYNEVRLLAHNLQPAELEQFGLSEALHRLINKLNDSQLIQFSLTDNGPERLSQELEFNLYSICLELANNIVNHSGATEAAFEFVGNDEQLQVWVTDNGRGFSTGNTSSGMGLRNVQERTKQMGGSLTIHSRPGEGTLFQFSVPLIVSARA